MQTSPLPCFFFSLLCKSRLTALLTNESLSLSLSLSSKLQLSGNIETAKNQKYEEVLEAKASECMCVEETVHKKGCDESNRSYIGFHADVSLSTRDVQWSLISVVVFPYVFKKPSANEFGNDGAALSVKTLDTFVKSGLVPVLSEAKNPPPRDPASFRKNMFAV